MRGRAACHSQAVLRGIGCLILYLLPGSGVLIIFCHGTGARRFCDDDLFVHVLAIPGGKVDEYAPAYSMVGSMPHRLKPDILNRWLGPLIFRISFRVVPALAPLSCRFDDRSGHCTGARRFCDDDLFIHVLAIPGGKSMSMPQHTPWWEYAAS